MSRNRRRPSEISKEYFKELLADIPPHSLIIVNADVSICEVWIRHLQCADITILFALKNVCVEIHNCPGSSGTLDVYSFDQLADECKHLLHISPLPL